MTAGALQPMRKANSNELACSWRVDSWGDLRCYWREPKSLYTKLFLESGLENYLGIANARWRRPAVPLFQAGGNNGHASTTVASGAKVYDCARPM